MEVFVCKSLHNMCISVASDNDPYFVFSLVYDHDCVGILLINQYISLKVKYATSKAIEIESTAVTALMGRNVFREAKYPDKAVTASDSVVGMLASGNNNIGDIAVKKNAYIIQKNAVPIILLFYLISCT